MRTLLTALLISLGVATAFAQNGATTQQGAPDAFNIGAGIGVLSNLASDDPSYQFFGSRLWNVADIFGVKALLEATAELRREAATRVDFGDAILASALVGANYYPIQTAFTPYIGAAGGLGYANGAGFDDAFGFDLSGVLGVLLFRGGPVEVNVEGNANFLFRDFNGDMPMTFTGRVGVLF